MFLRFFKKLESVEKTGGPFVISFGRFSCQVVCVKYIVSVYCVALQVYDTFTDDGVLVCILQLPFFNNAWCYLIIQCQEQLQFIKKFT